MGLEHSWQFQLPPCGFSARAWAGRAWSELRRQRGDVGVLCSEVRNIYVKCTGKPTVKPTSRCSVVIMWKGMCCLRQRHQGQELAISGETGEKEMDWMVQRPAKFQWFLEAPKDFDGVRSWYKFAVFSSVLPMNLYPHINGMGKEGKGKDTRSGLVTRLSVSLHPGEISTSTLTPTTGEWHIQLCRDGDVCSEGSSGGSDSYFRAFQEKEQAKNGTCAKAVAARTDHNFTATSSACAWTLPSWSEDEWMIWNDTLCICIYMQ